MGNQKSNYSDVKRRYKPDNFEISAYFTIAVIFIAIVLNLYDWYKHDQLENKINLAKSEYICSDKGGVLAYSGYLVCRNGELILEKDLESVVIEDESYYIKSADKND